MAVTAFPSVRLNDVLAKAGDFSATFSQYTQTYSGARDAVFFAYRRLGLAAGAEVLFPSFHCGVEVQAVLDAGGSAGFYRVGPDLEIVEENLFQKLDRRPAAVVVIHYFGFPQPGIQRIAEQCRTRGIPLIEDCAHALFSLHEGTPLGDFGSLAVYSLRKSLPIYDGGALRARGAESEMERTAEFGRAGPMRNGSAFVPILKDVARRAASPSILQTYRRIRYGEQCSLPGSRTNTVIPETRRYGLAMSGVSRRIARGTDSGRVVQLRRSNWHALASQIRARKVFSGLREGTCPLFLPIWVKNRATLISRLTTYGIETFVFGEFAHPLLPVDQFPEATRLRDEILCLPIHQGLQRNHISQVVSALDRAAADA